MRVLEYKVKGQSLKRKPGCDFSRIIMGSSRYLILKFDFNSDWDNCKKAVSFIDQLGKEQAFILTDDKIEVPTDITSNSKFFVSLTGKREDGYKINTNLTSINQEV